MGISVLPYVAQCAALLAILALGGCGEFTDAATRLAFDVEAGASHLGATDGARYTIVHRTPSRAGQCEGPYKVQFDKVGLIAVWCYDATGKTVSSHTTSHHGSYVVTPETHIVDKAAGAALTIELERRDGRAMIVAVD